MSKYMFFNDESKNLLSTLYLHALTIKGKVISTVEQHNTPMKQRAYALLLLTRIYVFCERVDPFTVFSSKHGLAL